MSLSRFNEFGELPAFFAVAEFDRFAGEFIYGFN